MENRKAVRLALLLAAALAAGPGCSGVTSKGKKAPACAGPLTLLNPEEFLPPERANTFNDQHQGVRPGAPQ